MFASDFIFDGQKASDYGLIISSFNGEVQVASGGEVEFNAVKPPDSDRNVFYGAQYNTPLSWQLSIVKNPCETDGSFGYFSTYEERRILKWLNRRDGYHWFSFIQNEDEEEIFYKVYINLVPYQVGGRTVGYDLTITADGAFGYSPLITRKAVINSEKSFILYIDTDTNNYILPEVIINGLGDFYIYNKNDLEHNMKSMYSKFINITDEFVMDSENGIVIDITPDQFESWSFLRLVDGKNEIITDSATDINLTFRYREVRRVIV